MLLYVNSYMFFPVVDDIAAYDEYGNLIDEVNSVVEFFDQVVLSNFDQTPDGNEAQHFHIVKHRPIVINQFAIARTVEPQCRQYDVPRQYAVMGDQKATFRAYDVVAPPPKA
jgi:hypothetical protein